MVQAAKLGVCFMKAKFQLPLFWIFFIEMANFVKNNCAKMCFGKFWKAEINASG
jgi:hypothetical protein